MTTSENSAHTNEYTVQVSAVTLGAQLLAIGCPSNERIPQLTLVLGTRHEHNETYATDARDDNTRRHLIVTLTQFVRIEQPCLDLKNTRLNLKGIQNIIDQLYAKSATFGDGQQQIVGVCEYRQLAPDNDSASSQPCISTLTGTVCARGQRTGIFIVQLLRALVSQTNGVASPAGLCVLGKQNVRASYRLPLLLNVRAHNDPFTNIANDSFMLYTVEPSANAASYHCRHVPLAVRNMHNTLHTRPLIGDLAAGGAIGFTVAKSNVQVCACKLLRVRLFVQKQRDYTDFLKDQSMKACEQSLVAYNATCVPADDRQLSDTINSSLVDVSISHHDASEPVCTSPGLPALVSSTRPYNDVRLANKPVFDAMVR